MICSIPVCVGMSERYRERGRKREKQRDGPPAGMCVSEPEHSGVLTRASV